MQGGVSWARGPIRDLQRRGLESFLNRGRKGRGLERGPIRSRQGRGLEGAYIRRAGAGSAVRLLATAPGSQGRSDRAESNG